MSTTPTQQQIEEIAERIFDHLNQDLNSRQITDIKLILTEATQPLLERVKELEQELEKRIMLELCKTCNRMLCPSLIESSECIFCTNKQLQSQLTTLEAACADMREALNTCIAGNGGHWFDKSKVDKAISSTSGQRIMEENRRMREALKVAAVNLVCLKNNMATGDWDAITKCIDEALSTN